MNSHVSQPGGKFSTHTHTDCGQSEGDRKRGREKMAREKDSLFKEATNNTSATIRAI